MRLTSIVKGLLSIFGKALFAVLSFIVMLLLLSLLVTAIGIGIGMQGSRSGLGLTAESEQPDYSFLSGNPDSENRLLQLTLQGIILGSPPANLPQSPFFSPWVTYGYTLQEVLKASAEDASIKGIFLHIQSPGGTIYGAQAIFDGIRAYREISQKPVLAYIEGLSASGAVMAMVGADAIYADYGSLIGSIGVIGPSFLYYNKAIAFDGGLLGSGVHTEGGIEQTTVFAGKGKDLGNPFRRVSAEELQHWQNNLENEYQDFVQHVAENRHIDAAMIREQMGAQIFDNKSAEELGLIDGTLNQPDALAKLAEQAGVGDDYQFVRSRSDKGNFLTQLLQGWYHARGQTQQQRDILQRSIRQDICAQTAHISLVYYGDTGRLCR
ncbi:Clp protease ClpP [candidate division KSB3 bacterium]|uniref:Clp protease ClpP n=1 Tax=candidate division KSB3 bacterium TaxID=2044937 RepID=A0A2G6E977_9BACT|nr:MAG: Clp protease ClpP [candidate division KSB3 bacterium]PIE29552.1 MAG: Clp protease ClpP [candidate division KSB3 bacterium]